MVLGLYYESAIPMPRLSQKGAKLIQTMATCVVVVLLFCDIEIKGLFYRMYLK
jgi:hypothetical protein